MFKFIFLALSLIQICQANELIVLSEQNTISFNQPFTGDYVAKKQLEVLQKSISLSSEKPLYLVLDTPGGSVQAGLNFIDTINSLGRKVHTITIFAASMGYQVVQELGKRYITPSGTLMSHRGALSGLSGQVPGELNSRLNHIESILEGMNKRAAKRVSMSLESYKQSIINELWVHGQDAVNKKHADAVANVRCDKNLINGVVESEFFTIFGPVKVKFSKCPLITDPLSVNFGNIKNQEQRTIIFNTIKQNRRKTNLTM